MNNVRARRGFSSSDLNPPERGALGRNARDVLCVRLIDLDALLDAYGREQQDSRRRQMLAPWRAETLKPLATVDNDTLARVERLRAEFPNFGEVLDVVGRRLALARLGRLRVIGLPPLLLDGPPGIGKTLFASQLADALRTGFEFIGLGGTTASFVLSGSSSSWAEGKPGRVSSTLLTSRTANPLIVLDELDKSTNDTQRPVQSALLDLLEADTARSFRDECLDLPMDASRILWVATSNERRRITEALQSRFECIAVRAPTREERLVIARSIWRRLLRQARDEWGQRFSPQLDDAVAWKLAASGIAPRAMKRVLEAAAGRVAWRLSDRDLRAVRYRLRPADIVLPDTGETRKPMGFVWTEA